MGLRMSDFNPNATLTGIAQEYGTGGGYVQDVAMPTRLVDTDAYKYMTWPLRDFIQGSQFDTRRAPGAPANVAEVSKGTWATGAVRERSLKSAIPDEILNNAPNPTLLQAGAVRRLMNSLRLQIEIELYTALNDITTHAYATPSVKWDASSGTIVIQKNMEAAYEAFALQCGFEPNLAIIPKAVARVMRRDSTILDLVKHTDPTLLVSGMLPSELWDVPVFIPGAIHDSANLGASASISRVWSADKVVLMYVDPTASTDPSAMTTIMRFASRASWGSSGWVAREFRDAQVDAQTNWYQAATWDDIKVTSPLVYIVNDVLT